MADTNARPNGTSNEKLGRITFRAWRRGFREADLVLGPFIEQLGPGLSDAELDTFEALLNEDDYDIYAWIIGDKPVPDAHAGPLMDKVQAFMRDHVAKAVQQGAG